MLLSTVVPVASGFMTLMRLEYPLDYEKLSSCRHIPYQPQSLFLTNSVGPRISGFKRTTYVKADEVALGQPTPSVSRGVMSARCRSLQEKCPHPPDRCSGTDRVDIVVLSHSLPSPYRPMGCAKSPIGERNI